MTQTCTRTSPSAHYAFASFIVFFFRRHLHQIMHPLIIPPCSNSTSCCSCSLATHTCCIYLVQQRPEEGGNGLGIMFLKVNLCQRGVIGRRYARDVFLPAKTRANILAGVEVCRTSIFPAAFAVVPSNNEWAIKTRK